MIKDLKWGISEEKYENNPSTCQSLIFILFFLSVVDDDLLSASPTFMMKALPQYFPISSRSKKKLEVKEDRKSHKYITGHSKALLLHLTHWLCSCVLLCKRMYVEDGWFKCNYGNISNFCRIINKNEKVMCNIDFAKMCFDSISLLDAG